MAITHRKGDYNDYDPSRMRPAEFGITLMNDPKAVDGRAVHIAFAAGEDKTLMTFEDAEGMIEDAAEEATAAATSQAQQYATNSQNSATESRSYAKGGTSSRSGEDTDNAMYYKNQAANSATAASNSATAASGSASTASTKASEAATSATNASGSATAAATSAGQAASSATAASGSATAAADSAEDAQEMSYTAEAWAVGTKNGIDVGSSDPQYHNNSKYYAEQAEAVAESIPEDYSDLSDDVDQLKNALTAVEIVDTASGAIASFADGSNGVPVKGLKVQLEPIQAGSGDPSPTNIRPISGRTAVTVTRTGFNVWDEEWKVVRRGDYDRVASKNPISVISGAEYYIESPDFLYIDVVDKYGSYIEYYGGFKKSTITIPNYISYIAFSVAPNYGATYNHDISINYLSTDHDYHAYQGQIIEIPLGQTVYGGTLDVTTGVLTVTMAEVDLGTLNWEYFESAHMFHTTLPTQSTILPKKYMCNIYITTDIWTTQPGYDAVDYVLLTGGADTRVRIKDTRYTTTADFKTAMSGVQLVYELANHVTVQLTAQQMTTLLGQNNVWSDADSVSVDYVADTKLYIAKVIADALS